MLDESRSDRHRQVVVHDKRLQSCVSLSATRLPCSSVTGCDLHEADIYHAQCCMTVDGRHSA